MEQFQTVSSIGPVDEYITEPLLDSNAPKSPPARNHSFDRIFLRRLGQLLRLLFKGTGGSIFQTSIILPYTVFLLLSCGVEVLIWFVGLIPSRFYAVLVSVDVAGYWKLVPQCLLLVLSVALVSSLNVIPFKSILRAFEMNNLEIIHDRARVFKRLQAAFLLLRSEKF
jgi:ATP-binding cassette subfamily D (ALD) protein 4